MKVLKEKFHTKKLKYVWVHSINPKIMIWKPKLIQKLKSHIIVIEINTPMQIKHEITQTNQVYFQRILHQNANPSQIVLIILNQPVKLKQIVNLLMQ